ncbi:MAG: YdeI/OmpD-associated family protein [Planctomycetota bacterium]
MVDPRVDEYIKTRGTFAQPILTRIREAFTRGRAPGCSETIKWGAPFFEQEGVLGGMSAFTKHVGFGFWRGKELEDPAGIFPKDIKASQMNIKVTDVKQLPTKKVLTDYVRRAVALNAAGKPAAKPRKAVKVPDMPPELKRGLTQNKAADKFWKTLPPSCHKEYIEWITEAKRDATRQQRLETTLEWLAEGKRRYWKYSDC